MSPVLLEIVRLKKFAIALALTLIAANVIIMIVRASYQEPALAASRSKWIELRGLTASSGRANASALHRQALADLKKLNSMITPKREFARVLSDLLEAASNSDVTTGAISYRPIPVKDEALLSYQLSLAVRGDYASVKSYLSDLQKYPELLIVDDMSLSNSDPFAENVVMNLKISVYLREGA